MTLTETHKLRVIEKVVLTERMKGEFEDLDVDTRIMLK